MIPISQPKIAHNAKRYLLDCLKTGWVSSKGAYIERFEKAFANFIGTAYAVATNSGTSSLHLGLAALGIGPGDEVIVPALTMIAAVLPVVYLGATPVLVDVEADTGNIDPLQIEAKITAKTKAIIAVHLHGHPADMVKILPIARKHRLLVIEDAAEAHGAQIRLKKLEAGSWKLGWTKVGSIGQVGCFSFYGNKIITTGEGGMVTTNDKTVYERVKSLQNLARTPGQHFYHQEIGFTYRMSNLQAALGLAELEEATDYIKRKREIASLYSQSLSNQPLLILPKAKKYARSIFWQYGICLKKISRNNRDRLLKKLAEKGIETRGFFTPLHRQPALSKRGLFQAERYPVAERLSTVGFCVPSGLLLKDSQIRFICRSIKEFVMEADRREQ